MLSFAQTLHHKAETPASASQNSALVPTWPQENSNVLKRKQAAPNCCIAEKRPIVDDEESFIQKIQLRPEVTLTIISKNSNTNLKEIFQSHIQNHEPIEENNMVCHARPVIPHEEGDDTSSNQVLSNLGNYKEIELTRINPTGQSVNVINQDDLFAMYSPDEDDEKNSRNCSPMNVMERLEETSVSAALVADLPDISIIKPCPGNVPEKLDNISESSPKKYGMVTRIQSRLEKAAAGLLRQQNDTKIQLPADIDSHYSNNNKNLILPTGRVRVSDLNGNKVELGSSVSNQTDETIICPSLFNDEPQIPVISSTNTTNNRTDPDFDPFSNIGMTVDDCWPNTKDRPYYAHGLPNPVGENRCWVNATLQALFGLPVFYDLSTTDTSKFSKLIRSLSSIQNCWKKGMTRNQGYTSSFNNFKEELSVLDKGYSSRAQQDVSEFLMNLFNFIKTEFESKSKEPHSNEIENIPNNEQDTPRKSQSTLHDSNKRSPLADISASTGQSRNSQVTNSEQQDTGNSKNSTPIKSQSDNEAETKLNPIDENFSLYMVENYVCGKCAKNRQQKVENLMLFIDLPSEDWGDTLNLVDMINTTCGTEHRELTCESCKHNKFTMNIKLQKLPKILTVQVKRYEMSSEGFLNKKSTAIDIPRILQLDHLVIFNNEEFTSSPTYEPVGIISHIGDSIDSGHYISFVKHDDKWFYYDDASVKILTDDEVFKVVQNNAYMIFFKDTESNTEQIKGG